MNAGTLEVQLLANLARLQKDMDDAKRIVGGAMSGIVSAAQLAGRALGALGIGLSAGAVIGWVRSLIDGVDALNDLRDATGASIEKLNGLERLARQTGASFDTAGTLLVKFNQVLNAAKKDSDQERVLKAIGLSIKELKALDPVDALQRTAVALNRFADDGDKARGVQDLFGKTLREVAPLLKDLAEAGQLNSTVTTEQAAEAEKFNKELFKLKSALLDAGRAIADPLVSGMNRMIELFKEGQKEGESLYATLGRLALWMANPAAAIGRMLSGAAKSALTSVPSLDKQIEDAQARVNWNLNGTEATRKQLRAELDALLAQKEMAREADRLKGRTTGGGLPSLALPPERDKEAEAAAKAAAKAAQRELEDQARLVAELSGVQGDYQQQLERLQVIRSKANITEQQYVDMVYALIQKQPMARKMMEDQTKALVAGAEEQIRVQREMDEAYVDADRSRTRARLAINEYAEGIAESNDMLALEMRLLGATDKQRAAALAQYRIELDLKKQIEAVDRNLDFDEAQREELRAQARAAAAIDKAGASARAELEEQKRILGSIDATAQDVWTNIFEGGQSAFKKLGNVLKSSLLDLLYQMTIRPFVIQIAASVLGMGGGGGAGVLGSLASSALGGGGGFLGAASPILGSIGPGMGISGALGGMFGGTGVLGGFGAGLTTGFQGLLAGNIGSTLGLGTGLMGSGAIAGGLGTLAGVLGPIGVGLALLSMLGGKKDERFGGGYSWSPGAGAAFTSGPAGVGGQIAGDQVVSSINATADSINKTLAAVGSSSQLSGFYAALESSKKGRGGVMSGGSLTTGGVFGEDLLGSNYMGDFFESTSTQSPDSKVALENFTTDLMQVTVQALQAATGIPQAIAEKLQGVDAEALTRESAQALLTEIDGVIAGVQGLREAAKALPFTNLKTLSFDAAAGLVALAGGIDTLGSQLSAYYSDYYTEAERTEQTTRQLTEALGALGYSLPDSRDAYRALVSAQDLNTESGRAAYAQLLKLAPAFADISTAAQEMADAWAGISTQLMDEVRRIRGLFSDSAALIYTQADFALATAQARAGDQGAAGRLSALSQSLLEQAAGSASSAEELAYMRAVTASSLEQTARMVGGVQTSVLTPLATAPATSQIYTPATQTGDLIAEVKALRIEVAALRVESSAENKAIANNTAKTYKQLDDWNTNGLPQETTS